MRLLNRLSESRAVKSCLTLAAIATGTMASLACQARGADTVSGTIDRFTTAPRGEIDGAVLSDGTTIHWPPHAGNEVSDKFKQGDRIEAMGNKETGPEGDSHFEVQSLKDTKNNSTVDISAIKPPKDGPRPPRRDAEQSTIRGKIERFTHAPRGEVDGAVLDSGTVLHWPPHVSEKMESLLSNKDRVEAVGSEETGPRGDSHFEVDKITNLTNDKSFDVAAVRPDGPRRGKGRPKGESATISGVVKRLTYAPRGEVDGAVLNDGTVIHWPPHREDEFVKDAKVGQSISVTGRREEGPAGDKRFEVTAIAVATNAGDAEWSDGRVDQSRDQRLRELQSQLDKIQAEIEQLRRKG